MRGYMASIARRRPPIILLSLSLSLCLFIRRHFMGTDKLAGAERPLVGG